jgi:TRAP-type C4-dicarboxylate transport system permease small subunit
MRTKNTTYGLILLSFTILVSGYLALWFLYPSILNRLGGFNLVSFSLSVLFALFIVLPSIYIFRYAQGKPFRRWQIEVGLTYAMLMIAIVLAFVYDLLLPPNLPIFWRYFVLPLATIVVTFYLLRRIPKIKEKLDELSKDW